LGSVEAYLSPVSSGQNKFHFQLVEDHHWSHPIV
jgi:hypothetical protein